MKQAALIVLSLFLALPSFAQEQYSHGDPTNDEQYMLEMVNRARANPAEEGALVIDTDDPAVQSSLTYWQINKSATKQAFTTYPQRPPLAFHPALITAARKHTADMIANNFQGHTGSDGSSLGQRFQREGYQSQGMYGENVAAYSSSVWFGHCGLIVDWGTQNQIDLGHRRNILNFDSQVFTEIGIGITYSGGGLQQGTVGPYVITQDFGVRNVFYITGVAYNDLNKNGFYDPGEGMAGVRVQPSRGGYFAMTSSSGGYAIPMSGSGSVTLTASGGGLTAQMVKTVEFSNENLKVDFAPSAQLPGSVVLRVPANNATKVARTDISFDWDQGQFASEYEIQIATATSFAASTIVFTQKKSSPGLSASVPACNVKYYWRVRAVNEAGNGAWSNTFSFTTDGKAPVSPTLVGPRGAQTFDNNGSVACTWNAATDAIGYHIKFSRYVSMSQPFLEDSTLTTTSFDMPVSQIPPAGIFYWSVRTISNCGGSTWASAIQVNATITDVEEELANENFAVRITPMPVTENAAIHIGSNKDGVARVSVIDLTGRTVASWDQEFSAGVNTIYSSQLGSLAAGRYTLIVVDGERIATCSFVH